MRWKEKKESLTQLSRIDERDWKFNGSICIFFFLRGSKDIGILPFLAQSKRRKEKKGSTFFFCEKKASGMISWKGEKKRRKGKKIERMQFASSGKNLTEEDQEESEE